MQTRESRCLQVHLEGSWAGRCFHTEEGAGAEVSWLTTLDRGGPQLLKLCHKAGPHLHCRLMQRQATNLGIEPFVLILSHDLHNLYYGCIVNQPFTCGIARKQAM